MMKPSTNDTNEFMASLPRGPLVRHLGQVHAIAHHLPRVGQADMDPENFLVALEYSLSEIARYTAEPERYNPPPYSAGTHDAPGVFDVRGADLAGAMRQAAQSLTANITNLRENLRNAREARDAALTPEQRDRVSKRKYDRAVAAERRAGLAFVAAEAARVRRELGLRKEIEQ